MPDLVAPDYQLARFLIERGLAAIYVIAFVVAARQFVPLAGERGLEPAPRILAATGFRQTPSIFHWRYSDRMLVGLELARLRRGGRPCSWACRSSCRCR